MGLTAVRGAMAAWGPVVLHVGVALVLAGAAYGRLPANSYRTVASLEPGKGYEVATGGDRFSVRLLDAGQERDPEGRPTRFWARVEVVENGDVVKSALIEPNRPLRHRGVNAVLQSISSSAYSVEAAKGESTGTVPVVFGADGAVAMFETVRTLEDPPWLVFIHDFRPSGASGTSGPAALVFMDPSGQLSHDWQAVGWVDEKGLDYSGVRFRLVAGGQGAQLLLDRDLGVPIVWLGFCLIVVGSVPLLGIRRQTAAALIRARGRGSTVVFGGSDPRLGPRLGSRLGAADPIAATAPTPVKRGKPRARRGR